MERSKNLYIDIHALQTVPPSNLNRDEIGKPKTAVYGGVTRSRVSSQSWKYAMRQYFEEHTSADNLGVRTRRVPRELVKSIKTQDETITDKQAVKMAKEICKNIGLKTSKTNTVDDEYPSVQALTFISNSQINKLAKLSINNETEVKKFKSAFNAKNSVDLSLFGRMVASDTGSNVDAACQVAHSISTHEVNTEFDYFIGSDDISIKNNSGAAMLNTTEFTSSTFYRYANINVPELNNNLQSDNKTLIETINLFIKSFVNSIPSGHINSFANDTLPDALLINIRGDRPVSLVAGFENAVLSDGGYMKPSIDRLKISFKKYESFVEEPKANYSIGMGDFVDAQKNLDSLLNNLDAELEGLLK